jgi:phage recombination protein Bet
MTETALVVQQFTPRQIDIIRRTVATGLSDAEIAFFLEVCKHRRLNPFNREIYAFTGKSGKLTIQVSIDGLRLLAERTGKYRGQLGPMFCGPDGQWREEWLENTPPAAAKVGVLREGFDRPIWAVARYESYKQDTPVWKKMPDLMLAKCSESLALRRAFPDQMAGLYSHEEMEQSGNVVVNSVSPISETLNRLYTQGKAKGLWKDIDGLYPYASAVLSATVTRDSIYELSQEQLAQLIDVIESEAEVAQAS